MLPKAALQQAERLLYVSQHIEYRARTAGMTGAVGKHAGVLHAALGTDIIACPRAYAPAAQRMDMS